MKKIVLSTLLVLSSASYAEEKPLRVWTWSEASFNEKDVNFVTHQQNKELNLNAPAYVKKQQHESAYVHDAKFQTVYLPQVVPIDADRRTCAGGTRCGQPWLTAEEVKIFEETIIKK